MLNTQIMNKIKVSTRNYSNLSSIKEWRNNLELFDFSITWEDGDFFFIELIYKNKSELLFILEKLGIPLKKIPEGYEKIIPGKIYREADGEKMPKSEIKDFPDYMQPDYIKIIDISAHCKIENGIIKITLVTKDDFNWYLTESGYENCLKIEKLIHSERLTEYVKSERFCDNYIL